MFRYEKITWFNRVSEAKDSENIDCYGSENPSQDKLEKSLMIKLVELYRLNKEIEVNSFIECFLP